MPVGESHGVRPHGLIPAGMSVLETDQGPADTREIVISQETDVARLERVELSTSIDVSAAEQEQVFTVTAHRSRSKIGCALEECLAQPLLLGWLFANNAIGPEMVERSSGSA